MDRFATFPSVPPLETPRLRLRALTIDDGPWYLTHFSRPEVVSGQGYPPPADLAAAEAELHRFVLDLFAARAGFRWGIATREDPRLIGSAGLFRWIDEPIAQAEVGYDLEPEVWGRGYMHEALAAILDLAFGRMALERVEAYVLAHNDRSHRVLERLGFQREALLTAHGEDEHGVLQDEHRFGLRRNAWSAWQARAPRRDSEAPAEPPVAGAKR